MTVLYEDNHIIAVSKTCNEIVQGDKTGDTPLSDIVKAYIKAKYNKPGEVFLGVPHRLDRPTSGVVLFARTSKALTRLNEMFREKSSYSEAVLQQSGPTAKRSYSVSGPTAKRSIIKTYWAIVQGCPKQPGGRLENYLIRNEKLNKSFIAKPGAKDAKLAILDYRVLVRGEHYSLLEINLLTGRHHQIRCQLSAIGCPVKGDLKYGAKRSNPDGGISLHARQIAFIHPVSKIPLCITAPVPSDSLWQQFAASVQ